MKNKDLIMFLSNQIDDKNREIGSNNMKNINLRVEVQHLKLAIKELNNAQTKDGEVKG